MEDGLVLLQRDVEIHTTLVLILVIVDNGLVPEGRQYINLVTVS